MDTNNNNQEGREERTPIQNQPYGGWTAGGPSGQTAGPSYTQNPYAYGNAANPYASTGTPVQPGQKPAKKRGGMVGLMLAGMLAFGMLVGGAGAEAVMIATGHGSPLAATATTQGTGGNATTSTELTAQSNQATINGIYKTISPSVVMINSVIQSTGRSGGFGGGTGQATGTGIVIDKQGDILTNNHVIEGGSNIKVVFSDGTEYAATVVGTAAQDDLAIIKVSAPADKLVPAPLGDSSKVQVGDEVIAIGFPYGQQLSDTSSVSAGIVSGLNRDGAGGTNSRTLTGLIQTDAAINPGNSGGPLVDAQGKVIGINTMIESPVEGFTGVGLSIPINHAKDLLSQLEQGGQVQRPWIGISATEISSGMQQQYNLPVSKGILVMGVTAGSPAEKAGLQATTTDNQGQVSQVGDIIVAIDSQQLGAVSDLTNYLNTKKPGDNVTLTILRDGQQQKVTVTLQAWAASTSTNSTGG